MDCGALTKPQSTALLLSSAIYTGAVLLRFPLNMTRLNFGRSREIEEGFVHSKMPFFSSRKSPILLRGEKKAFVFWGGGNFLSKKCALQCLLSLAPIRGWSVLLIEVWKSLFWCKISGSFLFCKSQSFYKNNFSVCKKCSQNSLNLGAQKFSAFLANFYPN